MREPEMFGTHGLYRSTSEEPSPSSESANAGVISDPPAAAKVAGRHASVARLGHFARWIAVPVLASLLVAFMILAVPTQSYAQVAVGVVVSFGPPALPVYYQPPLPGPGYYWVPGYWAWDPYYGYFWVPGTWVLAPFPGALWTPGYWGWRDADDGFVWFPGYWGPVVGYYGGINYGYGYPGYGYQGGYWNRGAFFYNRSVTNISTTNITNVYNKTVINNVNVTRVSYNGGSGGTTARPTSEELAAARERRSAPIAAQIKQEQAARANPMQRASENHGRPAVAATRQPGVFTGRDIVPASRAGAPYRAAPLGRTAESPAAGRAPNRARNEGRPAVNPSRHGAPTGAEQPAPPRGQPARETSRRSESRSAPSRPNASRPSTPREPAPSRPNASRPSTPREPAPHAAPRQSGRSEQQPKNNHGGEKSKNPPNPPGEPHR